MLDEILFELQQQETQKPLVVVSFGDYAASKLLEYLYGC